MHLIHQYSIQKTEETYTSYSPIQKTEETIAIYIESIQRGCGRITTQLDTSTCLKTTQGRDTETYTYSRVATKIYRRRGLLLLREPMTTAAGHEAMTSLRRFSTSDQYGSGEHVPAVAARERLTSTEVRQLSRPRRG
jgi:hypothetical protein